MTDLPNRRCDMLARLPNRRCDMLARLHLCILQGSVLGLQRGVVGLPSWLYSREDSCLGASLPGPCCKQLYYCILELL